MKQLNDMFIVGYGNKFDLNKMTFLSTANGGINFVGRSGRNHGVSSTVRVISETSPYPAGWITVALGGSLLSSFVQQAPFYTAQNVAVLAPRFQMTDRQKIFVCLCIRHNLFRYSAFGREANRTLRNLQIPSPQRFPDWVDKVALAEECLSAPIVDEPVPSMDTSLWRPYKLRDIFSLRKGKRLTKQQMMAGTTPFIGAIDSNNGVSRFIGQDANHAGNTITVSYNGSVAEAYFQPSPFWASDDVNVLYPKFHMTPQIALFLTAVIRREKYRFSYGRKWHLERMEQSTISLPPDSKGNPDWVYIQRIIERLPFSART